MPESIKWMFSVQIVKGPTVTGAGTIPTEAYQKIQVEIEAGATDVEVSVPADAQMLIVTSDFYPLPNQTTTRLTYTINDAAATTAVDLNAPLLLFGAGTIQQFAADLASFKFTSTLTQDVTIEILAAVDATPE